MLTTNHGSFSTDATQPSRFPGGSRQAAHLYPIKQLCPVRSSAESHLPLHNTASASQRCDGNHKTFSRSDPLIPAQPVLHPKAHQAFFPPDQPIDPSQLQMDCAKTAYKKYWHNVDRPTLYTDLHRISMYAYEALERNNHVGPFKYDAIPSTPFGIDTKSKHRRHSQINVGLVTPNAFNVPLTKKSVPSSASFSTLESCTQHFKTQRQYNDDAHRELDKKLKNVRSPSSSTTQTYSESAIMSPCNTAANNVTWKNIEAHVENPHLVFWSSWQHKARSLSPTAI